MHYVHRLRRVTVERLVSVFVVLSIFIIGILFVYIAQRKRIFEREYRIKMVLNEGHGLGPGSVVKLAGIEVGSVESVGFNKDNKIEVKLKIKTKFQDKIREDSLAILAGAGLAGDKYINITLGTFKFPMIGADGIINVQESVEITDLGSKLAKTIDYVEKILANIVEITQRLDSPSGELRSILGNVDQLTRDIKEGKGSLGAFLGDNSKLYNKLNTEIDSLLNSTKKVLNNLEKTTNELEGTAKKAGDAVPQTIKKVDTTLDSVKETVIETKRIIEALQQHWLIKDIINKGDKTGVPKKK